MKFRLRFGRFGVSRPSLSTHFTQIGGKSPSGLGNQIFNFSKAVIANHVFFGQIVAPRYGKGIHEIPSFLTDFSSSQFKWQLFMSKTRRRLLVINEELYRTTSEKIDNWDYGAVFTYLISENPTKKDFYHCSGMLGGYLGIDSLRDELSSLFKASRHEKLGNDIAIHIRGPVQYRPQKYSFRKQSDFQPEKVDFRYGDFNSETPTSFFTRVIQELGRFDNLKTSKVLVVTNLKQKSEKILKVTEALTANGFEFDLHNGDTMDALNSLMSAKVIVPSVSSFSLLAIFLSDARYFWPSQALFDSGTFQSIWGYESGQFPTGPTARSIEETVQYDLKSLGLYRGLPCPLKSGTSLEKWISSEFSDTPKCMDLIYYGVVEAAI